MQGERKKETNLATNCAVLQYYMHTAVMFCYPSTYHKTEKYVYLWREKDFRSNRITEWQKNVYNILVTYTYLKQSEINMKNYSFYNAALYLVVYHIFINSADDLLEDRKKGSKQINTHTHTKFILLAFTIQLTLCNQHLWMQLYIVIYNTHFTQQM